MPIALSQAKDTAIQSVQSARPNFPAFDSTYFLSHAFWLLISFGLFYLFVAKIIVPLIGNILEIRRDRIASDLDNAARLKSEADDLLAQNNQLMQQARHEFKKIINEAKEETKALTEKLRKESQSILANSMKDTATQVDSLKEQGYASIQKIAKEVIPSVIKAITNQEIASDVVETFVNQNLKKTNNT